LIGARPTGTATAFAHRSEIFVMQTRQVSLFVLCLVALGPCAAAVPDDDAIKVELKKHQGTWVATSSIYDDQAAPEAIVRSIKRIVTDDHVVWERDGKRFAGTKIELDLSRDPKTIDLIPDGGPHRGERILGIYKLEDDKLTICTAGAGQPRPKEFKAGKSSGCTLQTFRREQSPTK
jgi:uncharacterized protein (TIGR03067 family)